MVGSRHRLQVLPTSVTGELGMVEAPERPCRLCAEPLARLVLQSWARGGFGGGHTVQTGQGASLYLGSAS